MVTCSDDGTRRSVNEVICHGIPDQRKLQDGDIINIGQSLTAVSQDLIHV